ncbi:MAG: hypothetical protein WD737_12410 [Gemmatimonadota bacterium]
MLLPAEHFAAALVFLLLGSGGLVWVAPDLANGSFSVSRVVAVTHLFTLGWITTTIMGALYQFLPVALQVPVRSERVALATFAVYAPGLTLFVGGMAAGHHPSVMAGAVLFGSGLILFVGNLAATLCRAPDRNLTWWALVGAAASLLVTVLLGVALSGNLGWGYLGAHRLLALGVHIHVAVAGWVMLVVVGVAHRLLPMFLLSHGAPEWPGRAAAGLIGSGVLALVTLHHLLTPLLLWPIALLIASGFVAFLAQAAFYFRHRKKPALDPGMRLAAVALGFIALALVLAPFFLTSGAAAPRVATAYVTALVLGGFSLFVAGHYYKIVPFLVWFHRFGPLVGKQAVPKVADLYDPRIGNAAVALLGVGALGLVLATLTGTVVAARPAAALFAAGAALVAIQMLTISRRRP